MAMFNKEGPAKPDGRPTSPSVEAALSIIANGMRITGDVETSGVVKVDGEITGSIISARQVLLGRGGTVRGNIGAGEVVVGGTVEGSVVARECLELQSSAAIHGDIETRSIVVVEGARINGRVRMTDTAENAIEPLRIAIG